MKLVQVAFNLCDKVIAGTKGSILGRVPSVGPFGRIGRSWSTGLLLKMGERAGQSRIIGKCHHYSTAQRFELDFNDEVTTDVGHESTAWKISLGRLYDLHGEGHLLWDEAKPSSSQSLGLGIFQIRWDRQLLPVSHLQHLGFENRRPNFPKALYS